jgi:ATP-binding cassette, subfamily B, bacterial HlyB/CyaB
MQGVSGVPASAAASRRFNTRGAWSPLASAAKGSKAVALDTAASDTNAGSDSGLYSLALVSSYHQISCSVRQLVHELGLGQNRATPAEIVRAAKMLGFKARILEKQGAKHLRTAPFPAILQLKDGSFTVLGRRAEDGQLRVIEPLTRNIRVESAEQVAESFSGRLILITRRAPLEGENQRFGLNWFRPSIWRYRYPLLNVVTASLFVQLCGLITPIFFQITIDKVLVHKGYSTLALVVAGLVVLGLFQVCLQYVRSYILVHTTSRIDVELGARLFEHLMRLPLSYFESRATGLTVARVRELETIRNFLTGQGLTSTIDLLFTVIFVAVLFVYSRTLATIVVLSLPCYVIIALMVRPPLRQKMKERFFRSAASNTFLVESIFGIHTIKSLAVEPSLRVQWEERLAAYVRSAFQVVVLASVGQNAIQYVNKVTTALVLLFGAMAVINGDLTVGALVAFNMITNQVTAPILRLSQLWQDFQQVRISIDRLADVLNQPTESRALAQANLPPAKGSIELRNVSFRYRPHSPEVLKDISIDIAAGEMLGVVGASGSGKSTFTKLLQRLYVPERGQILIDGIDVAQVDPAWLRRQIGVVLQENMLFRRTVHENIALTNPGMPRAQVIALARLSGADEFINRMPLGYDTLIEELGANLSGGQRQRIAIARAIATNPRILIFDEATSALDYESEKIIQENMKQIARGRTVIIVAHRLAAVRDCDRIVGFDDGRIVEQGSHSELLGDPASIYGRLWRIQAGGETATIDGDSAA